MHPRNPDGRPAARRRSRACLAALATLLAQAAAGVVPAFPGAEGFGAAARGARAIPAPVLYPVTTLDDSGPGSLREAVSQPGRVVVFDVSGVIRVGRPLVFAPSLTILGQTAPGEGVTLYGNRVSLSGADGTICRYLRVRMGADGDRGADALGIARGRDIMLDHVSISWGRDETLSISGEEAGRITIQDSIISQGLRVHSAGGLVQTSGGVSILRTLYASNWMRNPKVKGVNDFINSVVYNWGDGGGYIPAGDSAGESTANIVSSYFIAGPESGVGASPFSGGNANFRLFHAGNLQDLDLDGRRNGVPVRDDGFTTLTLARERFAHPMPLRELDADGALDWVLEHAGASHRRDAADRRIVDEVRSFGARGAFIFDEREVGGIGELAEGRLAPDRDGDRMPDWWEIAAGTDPDVPGATDIGPDGYLAIERYANALAIGGVPGAFIESVEGGGNTQPVRISGRAIPSSGVALVTADRRAVGKARADAAGLWHLDLAAGTFDHRIHAVLAIGEHRNQPTPPSTAFAFRVDEQGVVLSFMAERDAFGPGEGTGAPARVDRTPPEVVDIRAEDRLPFSATAVFRVEFSEPVDGVRTETFKLVGEGAKARILAVRPDGDRSFAVEIGGLSGDGTLRLDVEPRAGGIVDRAGNALARAFTKGGTHAVRLPGSGVWTGAGSIQYRDTESWAGGVVATGAGATAEFSGRGGGGPRRVEVDRPVTVGRLVLRAGHPGGAGWLLTDAGASGSELRLDAAGQPEVDAQATQTPFGDARDVPAAVAHPHRIEVNLSGAGGLAKTGAGTLELARPNETLKGPLSVRRGIVQVAEGGALAPDSVEILAGQLRVAGGEFFTSGETSWRGGTGTGVVVSAGRAQFGDITASDVRNNFLRIAGGSVSARDVNFPRSGDSEAQTRGTGLVVSGGTATFRNVGIATGRSWAGMTISGGRVSVSDTLLLGSQTSKGRGGVLYLEGGELEVTGSGGLVMTGRNGSNADNIAKVLVTGGTASLSRIVLGRDADVNAGSALVLLDGGALYIGSGGIVRAASEGFLVRIRMAAGVLGALADWRTDQEIEFEGSEDRVRMHAADPSGGPRSIELAGGLTGGGGFTKTGAGVLTLSRGGSLGGGVSVEDGILRTDGPLALSANRALAVRRNATLEGRVAPVGEVVIGEAGTLSPGGRGLARWEVPMLELRDGARVRLDVGEEGDFLRAASVRLTGANGSRPRILLEIVPGELVPGKTYPLLAGPLEAEAAEWVIEGRGTQAGSVRVTAEGVAFAAK